MKWGPAFAPFILLVFIFFLPSLVSAQVVINEVMYNPQGNDTGREWIELYNAGANDVSMVGGSGKGSWRINDGSNHTLTDPAGGTGRGSLTIPAGGYLVIASDPNDFVSGEYAGLPAQAGGSYSVIKSSISLNNNGATITLLDGTGATVDTISYNPSQDASDDGSSLQRQADGSWIAALPTPGAANSTTPYVAPPSDTNPQSDATSSADQSAGQTAQTQTTFQTSSYVPPPTPDIFADAGSDRTVIVGADVEFDGSAYDKTQTLLEPSTVRFLWNFGDGATAEGPAVLHHFSYPGRYAVVLNIAQAKHAASDPAVVTAEPAALSLLLLPSDGIQIQNLAGHDLDLSGWVVREDGDSFAAQFMLPDHSEILSGSSMSISSQTLSFRASSSTTLEYPNGVFALSVGESPATSTPEQAGTQPVASSAQRTLVAAPSDALDPPAVDANSDDLARTDTEDADTILDTNATDSSQATTAPTLLRSAQAGAVPRSEYLWWVGAITLALAVGAAALAASRFKKGEWDIIEDSGE